LSPNGWMHQDATWYGGRPQPRGLCVRWRPSPLLPKKEAEPGAEPAIFGPCLLWPNGWMDQDGTWHGGIGLGPVHIMLDGDRAPLPKRGQSHPPQFSAHLSSGQTAGWIKMPLGTEVGLGLRDIVFDVDPATPRKRAHPHLPNFWPMSIVARWLDG